MTPEAGSIVGGKYRLERPLAAGGMGSVWTARDVRLEVAVAVKFMSAELAGTPSAGARFEREAKAAAQLKSNNVVHIYDYGVEDGSPYIAMELLEGEDLAALLDRERRLPLARAAEILAQTSKALRMAHEAHIVHRDIKPSNLFLAKSGGETVIKVLDFGIAKESQPTIGKQGPTTTGLVLGSPLYMSPEQARGGTIGKESDLWSLGVVAFEMITGAQPFHGATVGDVIAKICGDELPVPSRFAPDLPPSVDAFFIRALARDPQKRFESARSMAEAFAELAGDKAAARRLAETQPQPAPAPPRGRLDDTLPAPSTVQAESAATEETAPAPRSPRRFAVPVAIAGAVLAFVGIYAIRGAPAVPAGVDGPPATSLSVATSTAPVVTPRPPETAAAALPPASAASASAPSASAPVASAPAAPRASIAPSARPVVKPAVPRATGAPSAKPVVDPVFGLPAPE